MNDQGIMIISEEDLDEFFNPSGLLLPPNILSGCNIKTSCYGLFLVGLDECSRSHKTLLNKATRLLPLIPESTAFTFLALHYPPDDISYKGIIKLTKAIIKLYALTEGKEPEDLSVQQADDIAESLLDILGINEMVVIFDEDEYDED